MGHATRESGGENWWRAAKSVEVERNAASGHAGSHLNSIFEPYSYCSFLKEGSQIGLFLWTNSFTSLQIDTQWVSKCVFVHTNKWLEIFTTSGLQMRQFEVSQQQVIFTWCELSLQWSENDNFFLCDVIKSNVSKSAQVAISDSSTWNLYFMYKKFDAFVFDLHS